MPRTNAMVQRFLCCCIAAYLCGSVLILYQHFSDTQNAVLQSIILVSTQENASKTSRETEHKRSHREYDRHIPHRLIFVYNQNILEARDTSAHYENVMNTIRKYKDAWQDETTPVLFLDDRDCLRLIEQVEPRLVDPYRHEPYGANKGGICRTVALYLFGGYYFRVDMEVVEPLVPKNGTSIDFITSWGGKGPDKQEFFDAILGASARNPIIYATIQSMVYDWYYNETVIRKFEKNWFRGKDDPLQETATNSPLFNSPLVFNEHVFFSERYQSELMHADSAFIGPSSLWKGYQSVTMGNSTSSHWLLEKVDMREHFNNIFATDLNHRNTSATCDFLVRDATDSKPYFCSCCNDTKSPVWMNLQHNGPTKFRSAAKQMPNDTNTISPIMEGGYSALKFPVVDAVVTWVNGSEPHFLAQLAHYTDKPEESRYRDLGQLRYTLRSIMMYAPWIRQTFIVVSDSATQTPSWLDADDPFINVVQHTEIWEDTSQLPTFSSPAIEANLHRIPGLSPSFLYFNDDVALTQPLRPHQHLLHGPNTQILYEAWEAPVSKSSVDDAFGKSLAHVRQLYNQKYGYKRIYNVPAHVPMLMNTTVVKTIQAEWAPQYNEMMKHSRFRNDFDMQAQFTYHHYIKCKLAPDKKTQAFDFHVKTDKELHFGEMTANRTKNKQIFQVVKDMPRLFLCLQDKIEHPSDAIVQDIVSFYEELFPAKAPWELPK